jgi:hypothetical protein
MKTKREKSPFSLPTNGGLARDCMSESQAERRLELIVSSETRIADHNAAMKKHFADLDTEALDLVVEDFCAVVSNALDSLEPAVDAVALSATLSEIADLLASEIKRIEVRA